MIQKQHFVTHRAKGQSLARRKRIVANVRKYVGAHRHLVAISAILGCVVTTAFVAIVWVSLSSLAGSVQARASPSTNKSLIDETSDQGIKLKLSTILSFTPQPNERTTP